MNGNRPVLASRDADLIVGTTYSGETPDIGDEPINRLLACGNMGGFRARGSVQKDDVSLVVLVTTFADSDWPDEFDRDTRRFTYFGDNKKPGRDLHDTSKRGNQLLRWAFSSIHVRDHRRANVPPFFLFAKKGPNRAATFLGVAVPGADDCPEAEDLVAFWTTRGNDRFQNYKSLFSVLDIEVAPRSWIRELESGQRNGEAAPEAWTRWVETGMCHSAS